MSQHRAIMMRHVPLHANKLMDQSLIQNTVKYRVRNIMTHYLVLLGLLRTSDSERHL